jgi:hypothetical protein
MMPDNWGYVAAAYVVAAGALFGYWRHLCRRTRALSVGKRRSSR